MNHNLSPSARKLVNAGLGTGVVTKTTARAGRDGQNYKQEAQYYMDHKQLTMLGIYVKHNVPINVMLTYFLMMWLS